MENKEPNVRDQMRAALLLRAEGLISFQQTVEMAKKLVLRTEEGRFAQAEDDYVTQVSEAEGRLIDFIDANVDKLF